MLRSLYSGISSLRSHQTMLDVTGNNIANANTTGFKASRAIFEDTLSQMVQAPRAPQGGAGGTNPAQVGLGVQVAGVTADLNSGAAQQTGRSLDMMVNGDGYFVVNSNGEQLYTRAGAFTLDAAGQLVTPSGALVMGWAADANGVVNTGGALNALTFPVGPDANGVELQSFSLGADGTIIGSFSDGARRPIGQVAVSTFANAAGLEKAGGSMLRATVNSGDPQVGAAGDGGRGTVTSGTLEMSNVDLSQEFTNLIIAQRGFQAGSRVITTSDELLQELVNLKR